MIYDVLISGRHYAQCATLDDAITFAKRYIVTDEMRIRKEIAEGGVCRWCYGFSDAMIEEVIE